MGEDRKTGLAREEQGTRGTETTHFKLARINKRVQNPVTLKYVNPKDAYEWKTTVTLYFPYGATTFSFEIK